MQLCSDIYLVTISMVLFGGTITSGSIIGFNSCLTYKFHPHPLNDVPDSTVNNVVSNCCDKYQRTRNITFAYHRPSL